MKNLLQKISINAIYKLTQGSHNLTAIQEKLKRTQQVLNILNGVDLIAIKHISDSNKLLIFNLNYKEKINWIYSLPQFELDEAYQLESVVEWLTGGEVELVADDVQLSQVDINEIAILLNLL
jgi:hypothetical protein